MSKRIALVIGLSVLFMAGIAGYFARSSFEKDSLPQPPAPAGETRLDFSLADIDGNMRKLSEWDGKARLVNFWATWCAPCRREIPLLKKTQDEQGGNNVQVIGIAVDFPEQVEAYAEEAQFNYPILVGQEDAMAAAESTGIEFIGMPFTMVVAPSGELLKTHIGEIVEEHIDEIVAVFDELAAGSIDIDGARDVLREL